MTRVFFGFCMAVSAFASIFAAFHRDWFGALTCGVFALMVPTLYRAATFRG